MTLAIFLKLIIITEKSKHSAVPGIGMRYLKNIIVNEIL